LHSPEENKQGGLTAPTHLLYHSSPLCVNSFSVGSSDFYHLYDLNRTFLSNIPSCKKPDPALIYKYKEVIPMI
jgi:hypothetical protein